MNAKHYLTDHARLRLAERTTLTAEEFLSLADCCAALVYVADAETHYKMIWSSKDRNGYILVTNPSVGAIITIKRVLTQSGYPCQIHDAARKPHRGHEEDVGVSKITSSMLEQAVAAVGADISEAQHIIDVLKEHEKTAVMPRAWHYRWTLRFLCAKPGGGVAAKSKTLGKEAEIRNPPEALIAEAAAAVKAEAGWDATLLLVERDSMSEVGEWDLADALAA